jgi:predicted outer membrane repeat protein
MARVRPALEALEDRSLPSVSYVVTDPGSGFGSASDVTLYYAVRQAVLHNQTAVITFSPSLAEQTITLTHPQHYAGLFGPTGLAIGGTADVNIDGSDAPGLTIASCTLRVFAVNRTASLSLDHLTLSGGTASGGGAVYDSGKLRVDDCTFTNNTAGNGGAILVHTDRPQFPASATIVDSTFRDNSALFNGGAIFVAIDSRLTVSGCTFDTNSAAAGGGVFCFAGSARLTNSTFAGNFASGSPVSSGGGVFNLLGIVKVSDCTFSGNSADGFGGAIGDAAGILVLNNSILANSPSGGDFFEATPFISIVCGSNDLIGDGSFLSYFTNSLSGNAGLDPQGLRDNGGPTETIALLGDSPAVGAGDLSLVPPRITTDQRGAPRSSGGQVDIGASQFFPAATTTTTLIASTNPTRVGQSVTFTANVAAGSVTPGGTVTFFVDARAVATVQLVNGSASFSTAALSPGGHAVTARYIGSSPNFFTSFLASDSVPLVQQVNAIPVPKPAPVVISLPVQLIVSTLAPGVARPSGAPPTPAAFDLLFRQILPELLPPPPSVTYVLALRDQVSGGMPSEMGPPAGEGIPAATDAAPATDANKTSLLELAFADDPVLA